MVKLTLDVAAFTPLYLRLALSLCRSDSSDRPMNIVPVGVPIPYTMTALGSNLVAHCIFVQIE